MTTLFASFTEVLIFAGTATILEKLDVLNDALKQKSFNFLDQKQAEFDGDYEDFMQHIVETRVSQLLCAC